MQPKFTAIPQPAQARRLRLFLLLTAATVGLMACGSKGPLYIPTPEQRAAAQAAADKAAARKAAEAQAKKNADTAAPGTAGGAETLKKPAATGAQDDNKAVSESRQ